MIGRSVSLPLCSAYVAQSSRAVGRSAGLVCGPVGDEPVSALFALKSISAVFGLRLAGGRDVVVKVREDDGRAVSCVAAQARLAERGFPCARPLTPVVGVGALAVHAEESRPGGDMLRGDSPDVAVRYAAVCSPT